jgi:hypothetical protein
MLKTFLILEYKKEPQDDPRTNYSLKVLQIIIEYLKSKDLECDTIKNGSWCCGSVCMVRQTKISFGCGLPINAASDKTAIIEFECNNYFSFWRSIFNRPREEEICSGEALREFIKFVDEAIGKNEHIAIRHDWMDRSEYVKMIKSQRSPIGSIGLLKDPLRKKGFWE